MPFKRRNGADVRASLNDDIDHTDYTPYVCTSHAPVAGMMHVHDEDLDKVAAGRKVMGAPPIECHTCGMSYVDGVWVH